VKEFADERMTKDQKDDACATNDGQQPCSM
jgi:hypothetical protein